MAILNWGSSTSWNSFSEYSGYPLGKKERDLIKVGLHPLNKIKARKVIEFGCGLGCYANEIRQAGSHVLGVDVSPTVIEKEKQAFPVNNFFNRKILDFSIYDEFRPDAIIMAELTWYFLEMLDSFLSYLRKSPEIYLIHLLKVNPKGVLQFGKDKFTKMEEKMRYFSMNYLEFGEKGHLIL